MRCSRTKERGHSRGRVRIPRSSVRAGGAVAAHRLRAAVDRQERRRIAYRRVLGSPYEADAYRRLLASTRDLVRIRAELARTRAAGR